METFFFKQGVLHINVSFERTKKKNPNLRATFSFIKLFFLIPISKSLDLFDHMSLLKLKGSSPRYCTDASLFEKGVPDGPPLTSSSTVKGSGRPNCNTSCVVVNVSGPSREDGRVRQGSKSTNLNHPMNLKQDLKEWDNLVTRSVQLVTRSRGEMLLSQSLRLHNGSHRQ